MKLKFLLFTLFFLPFIHSKDHFVSFIIPCYNCEKWVADAIHSISQQHLKSFEIICTDDGSSDKTLAVLKNCQSNYPNIHIYVHEKNKGGGATRNTCIRYSQGDLIFCLDADNVLCPNSVQKLIDLIDSTECDVASFAEGKAFKGNFIHFQTFTYAVPNHTYDLYTWATNAKVNPAYGGNYLFTRKSYDRAGGYPEDMGCGDTFGFGVAQLATGSIMRTAPDTFYWHRCHDDSYYMREAKKNNTDRDTCKAFHQFSEIFSPESQKIIKEKTPAQLWNLFENKQLELVPDEIMIALFNGYEYKCQKDYVRATEEFSKAISAGCQSEKIVSLIHEMKTMALQQVSQAS
jgi:glycosyltransferase involved in cell wall biosynthesis